MARNTSLRMRQTLAKLLCARPVVPDAAFILENVETGQRGLFFLEMDMATERIVTQISHDKRITLRYKIEQYDRYLAGGRFARTYSPFGEFRYFTLLFVTIGETRVNNIRNALADLPREQPFTSPTIFASRCYQTLNRFIYSLL